MEVLVVNQREPNVVEYLPGGISTLKLRIHNDSDEDASGRLFPETKSEDANRVVWYDNLQRKNLWLVGGGGKEEGFDLSIKPGESQNLYFSVIHKGDSMGEYSVKFDFVGDFATPLRTIRFVPPKSLKEQKVREGSLMRSRWTESDGGDTATILLGGTYVPKYYSRWWPEIANQFASVPCPKVRINLKRGGEPSCRVKVVGKGGQRTTVADVGGDISGSLFDSKFVSAELFYLEDHFFDLRLWFYWLDKEINVEIPDIERFDFILDARRNKIVYVGTDFHWTETWSEILGPIANCEISGPLNGFMQMVRNGLKFEWGVEKPPLPGFDPMSRLQPALDSRGATELAWGMHTHVPSVKDGRCYGTLTSADVRLG
ncbi:MAG: hypothetical protein LYZ66_01730 [Nitrososphaerales archaeon]|nr:hypothetical protein [Nitrososphaerales archaeon]